jgi:hypothetical protein
MPEPELPQRIGRNKIYFSLPAPQKFCVKREFWRNTLELGKERESFFTT